jgi:cytochrome c oxidase subunit III
MSTGNTTNYEHHTAHHFDSAAAEYNASKLGIWVFLMTEILMFGGLFVGYIIFHQKFPETFAKGATFLDWKLGSLNTVVLIFSSLTMALSIYYAQMGKKMMVLYNLYITFFCGVIFMVVKAFEYAHKIHEGLLPGQFFSHATDGVANLPIYFSFYFCGNGIDCLVNCSRSQRSFRT